MKNKPLYKFEESIGAVYPQRICLRRKEDHYQGFFLQSGVVRTPHGIVEYRQYMEFANKLNPSGKEIRYLQIYFIYNGEGYTRRWEGYYGDKTVTRLCNQLVRYAVYRHEFKLQKEK